MIREANLLHFDTVTPWRHVGHVSERENRSWTYALKGLTVRHVGMVSYHLCIGLIEPFGEPLQYPWADLSHLYAGSRGNKPHIACQGASTWHSGHPRLSSQMPTVAAFSIVTMSTKAKGIVGEGSTSFVRESTSTTSSPSTIVFRNGFIGSSWWGKNSPVSSR